MGNKFMKWCSALLETMKCKFGSQWDIITQNQYWWKLKSGNLYAGEDVVKRQSLLLFRGGSIMVTST